MITRMILVSAAVATVLGVLILAGPALTIWTAMS